MTDNIRGKVVVITGASSGNGEATVRHLARRGATVVLGARRGERLEKLEEELTAAGHTAPSRPSSPSEQAQPGATE